MVPLPSLSLSSGPAVSGTAPQDGWAGFMSGNFTAATGKASATGGTSWVQLLMLAGVVWLVMRRRGG